MPCYRLVVSPQFWRDLRKLDAETHRRILDALARLEENPSQGKKLTGVEVGQWRIRVGDYRIRYDVEGDHIFLYRVRHRREIYRE